MTVANTTNRITAAGDSASTVFSVTYYFLQSSDLVVTVDGVVKALGTDYTVTGAGVVSPPGGTVIFTVAPATGSKVVIRNVPPVTQLLQVVDNVTMLSSTIGIALDKLTILIQNAFDQISTALLKNTLVNSIFWDMTNLEVKNVAPGTVGTSAATVAQVQAVQVAAGNVPNPVLGDVGKFLKATAAGVYSWFDFSATGSAPMNLRRTENDAVVRKILSLQSGSGAGNDYSLQEAGDGANNVATVQEFIGTTLLRSITALAHNFPLPIDFTDTATPAAPGATKTRLYSKAGALAVRAGASGLEQTLGIAPEFIKFHKLTNNGATPNTKADWFFLSATLVNASGLAWIYNNLAFATPLTCDLTVNGAGGLDTGAKANSATYYFYAIANGPAFANLSIIASVTPPTSGGPLLPGGYFATAYLGVMITDGTGILYRTLQKGADAQYQITAATNTASMRSPISGASGNPTTPVYTAVNLTGFVPPTASRVRGSLGNTSTTNAAAAAPNNAYGPFNSTTNPPPVVTAQNVVSAIPFDLEIENAITSGIFYTSLAGGFMGILGWKDSVNAV